VAILREEERNMLRDIYCLSRVATIFA